MVATAAETRQDASAGGDLSSKVVIFKSDLPTPDDKLTALMLAADKAYTRASQAALVGDTANVNKFLDKGDKAERAAEKRAKALHVQL